VNLAKKKPEEKREGAPLSLNHLGVFVPGLLHPEKVEGPIWSAAKKPAKGLRGRGEP